MRKGSNAEGTGGARHQGQEQGLLAGEWATSPPPAVSAPGKRASSLACLTELLFS